MKINQKTRNRELEAGKERELFDLSNLWISKANFDIKKVSEAVNKIIDNENSPNLPKRVRSFQIADWTCRTKGMSLGHVLVHSLNQTKPKGWKHTASYRFPTLEKLKEAFTFVQICKGNDDLAEKLAISIMRLNDNGLIELGWQFLNKVLRSEEIARLDDILNLLIDELPASIRENPKRVFERVSQDRRHIAELKGNLTFDL